MPNLPHLVIQACKKCYLLPHEVYRYRIDHGDQGAVWMMDFKGKEYTVPIDTLQQQPEERN